MKKYSILIALLAKFSFSACEDAIDLVPRSELTANGFWDSEDGAKAAHIGMYSNLRSQAGDFWSFGELRSDLWGGNTLETPSNLGFLESDFSANTSLWRLGRILHLHSQNK